jgi:hypothetical protein
MERLGDEVKGDLRFEISEGRVAIACASIYTGGIARLVTQMRSAISGKWVFEGIEGKNLFVFEIFAFLMLRVLVTKCAAREK